MSCLLIPLRALVPLALVAIAMVVAGAGRGSAGSEQSEYERAVIQARLNKDVQFFDPEKTVLRPKELAKFTGLRYFPVDSTFRYRLPFEHLEDPPTVLIAKQRSSPVPYMHLGNVPVPGPDTTISLAVYWNEEMGEGTGWIPFTDATNNRETYGGGRYLDVSIHDDGTAEVDFNMAENPFCVYNAIDYNCAIPPAQNRLTFPVTSGEKKALLLDG